MLETIGLLLAVIDFFDLTPRLEVKLDRFTERFARFRKNFRFSIVKSEKEFAQEAETPQGRLSNRVFQILCGVPAALFSIYLAYQAFLIFSQGKSIDDDPSHAGIRQFVVVLVLIPFGVFPITFITLGLLYLLCTTTIYYLLLTPVVKGLRLMEAAPRGIVGSIGLILAVVSFLSRVLIK
jgi:hypothetical protein